MIPEYGNVKFECPHCNTVASQDWFTSNNASSTATGIVNHLYLNYRPSVNDYAQERIVKFLEVIEKDFKNNFSLLSGKTGVAIL